MLQAQTALIQEDGELKQSKSVTEEQVGLVQQQEEGGPCLCVLCKWVWLDPESQQGDVLDAKIRQ